MLTLLDLCSSILIFVDIIKGAAHDINSLDKMPEEPGSYYIIDKGYIDFYHLNVLIHQCRAFYVSRAKDNISYKAISSLEVDKIAATISDQLVRLTGYKSSKFYPEKFRLVVYEDYAASVVYTLRINDFDLPALTIAELYRERWKIELFFKWIKQHLHIKVFYDTSPNAVYCQIWIAICTYLLIAIAKRS